ncbi:uncharacterized protein PHACADRAFT_253407 [Phanerochaete carnosa HHB-10118-sp]|uniref:Uncharacterized protein n=1 Tax=Phanerochaete carnosa (strain HHB-10118-sp) TaxID=650164 RepID=K5VXQ1_PHACS|nr:uncharacterized protein PHACADRAFT_253407 [Phanerochaete carnosa HHB-10118-sp]EKM56333.1 hypothetical protein PHACADRAFT_253407 [Phanerochaete carnosa HHB-10118-sp]
MCQAIGLPYAIVRYMGSKHDTLAYGYASARTHDHDCIPSALPSTASSAAKPAGPDHRARDECAFGVLGEGQLQRYGGAESWRQPPI